MAEPADPWSGDTYVVLADGSFTYWQGEIGGWRPPGGNSSPSSLPHITDPAEDATIPVSTYTYHGTTAPGAGVNVYIRKPPDPSNYIRANVTADGAGAWTANVNLTTLGAGEYMTWAQSVIGGQSAYSPVVHMTVA